MRNLILAAGTDAIFSPIHACSYPSLNGPPIPQTGIYVFHIFGTAGDAFLMLGFGMMKYGGALVASVPLLVKFHITPFNDDGPSFGKSRGQFPKAGAVYTGKGRPGYMHQFGSLFLLHTRIIRQS
jgi:hypothetical protein